jgi:hypothetical protein
VGTGDLEAKLLQGQEEAERLRKMTAADIARVAAQHAEEVALLKQVGVLSVPAKVTAQGHQLERASMIHFSLPWRAGVEGASRRFIGVA